jgi:hypothetical protein
MCSGGKALSTASFPQTHRKNPRQAVPMSVVSVSAFRVVDSDEHFYQCTMRGAVLQTLARCMNVFITSQLEETPGTTRKLWLFPACACSESSTLKLACQRVSALERKVSTNLCFFERAKASDRPFKRSSESSFTFHNDSISLLSNFRRSNSSLLCSLQPCLLCALCLRFAPRGALPTCRVFLQGSSLIARPGVCPFVQIRQESDESIPNSWTSLHSGSRWCLSHALDVHQD